MIDQRLKIAVFIDFDNIEIGVKTTLHTQFDIAAILDGIKERGEVVTKVAYGDWKRAGDYGRLLSQHAIRMVQRNLTPGGDKNGADINLALDALEMAFTHDHINAFVIVGGDSDFITLVEKLKQYDKKVFVVGGRQFTSQVMQKNCHEFIAYENLVGARRPSVAGPKRENGASTPADVAKVIPLVKRALKVLADREVSPQLGLLKSTLLQLDSTFSERDYGASTFRDFIEKIAKTGIITLRHSGRSMLVDAADAEGDTGPAPQPAEARLLRPHRCRLHPLLPRRCRGIRKRFNRSLNRLGRPLIAPHNRLDGRCTSDRSNSTCAPPIRISTSTSWGFATIMEFLRLCQREGLFRLERDRRGQIRVFPGSVLQPVAAAQPPSAAEQLEELAEPVQAAIDPVVESPIRTPLRSKQTRSPWRSSQRLAGRVRARLRQSPIIEKCQARSAGTRRRKVPRCSAGLALPVRCGSRRETQHPGPPPYVRRRL